MKYLRSVSDLHLDFDFHHAFRDPMDSLWMPPSLDGDDETALIIAGDLWTDRRFVTNKYPGTDDSWLHRVAKQFKYVVLVLGNHDYWGCNLLYEPDKVRLALSDGTLENVFLLERDAITLDQVKFVGGTLWTDFKKQNPILMNAAVGYMNDYVYMKYGKAYHIARPFHVYPVFAETKRFIFNHSKRDADDQTVVVVTHMGPSIRSVDDRYRDPRYLEVNHLYYTDLEQPIEESDIDYWFHGHMHDSKRYKIGETEVVLNPRGYNGENPAFDPTLRITLN